MLRFLPAFLLLLTTAACAQQAGPLAPEEARRKLTVLDDLTVDLVLAEPEVAQPLFLSFDERGRMWVMEYRQYPDVAGSKILSRDRFWRAVFDKLPLPPPKGERGADRISIHEDTDGDGTYDKHRVFVDGLNIATACARGRGGVWVLNPPYLLFYPDADDNDVPDGDPIVHLEGFGIEDTHSVVNSLRWGPDGWLYAAQGSTVSGHVKRPAIDTEPKQSMGQLIWRYHPETRRYEIFSEGGGNAFGVDIDVYGRIFSGHNGGDTRGFHYMQGAYLQKGFTKHGPLSNPYAFGFFPPMKHHAVPRFTHCFVIYHGGALPERYHGTLFGVAPLLNHVVWSEVSPVGSTFQTKDLGHALTSSDPWFRPIDVKVGPDGGVYVADWYDSNVSHLKNQEGILDRTNGRVYRLRSPAMRPLAPFDLRSKSSAQLVELLRHPNIWFRQTALRLLGDRRDRSVLPQLGEMLTAEQGQPALEALWATWQTGGWNEDVARTALGHANPQVRVWGVRFCGETSPPSASLAARLAELAGTEANVEVRAQLACTAKRLDAARGLPIVRRLAEHDEDVTEPRLPLLAWWAIEAKCAAEPAAVVEWLEQDAALWKLAFAREHLVPKAIQRFAATGQREDWLRCARLIELATQRDAGPQALAAFETGVQGKSLASLPPALVKALAAAGGGSVRLRVRLENQEAIQTALAKLADASAPVAERIELAKIFGEVRRDEAVGPLLTIVEKGPAELRGPALRSLGLYNQAEIPSRVLALFPQLDAPAQEAALGLLVSRTAWAQELLAAVRAGKIDKEAVPREIAERITWHRNAGLVAAAAELFGTSAGATTEQMKADVVRWKEVVAAGSGDPYAGKKAYLAVCGKCHTLFGQGGRLGPDLTAYKRDDLETLLLHVANPSAEIREGFETTVVVTQDGRSAVGFLVEQDPQTVVLLDLEGQTLVFERDQIEELLPQRKSLMPEGLLKTFTDQQVRDLLAYLRTTQPLND